MERGWNVGQAEKWISLELAPRKRLDVDLVKARVLTHRVDDNPSSISLGVTAGCRCVSTLGSHPWPVVGNARPRGLEAPLHVKFTIGMAVDTLLAAEVEVPV